MRKFKTNRLLAGLVALIITLTAINLPEDIFAASELQFYVQNVQAQPGQIAAVDIRLDSNPGIFGVGIELSYNDAYLELLPDNRVIGTVLTLPALPQNWANNPLFLAFEAGGLEDTTATGLIITLHFRVSEDAPYGNLPLSLAIDNPLSVTTANLVPYSVSQGGIEVVPELSTPSPTEEPTPTVRPPIPTPTPPTLADELQFVVGSVQAQPGQIAAVDIRLDSNPGIFGVGIELSYNDTYLELLHDNRIIGTVLTLPALPQNWENNPLFLAFEAGGLEDTTATGLIITLPFMVSEDAPYGNLAITMSIENPLSLTTGQLVPYTVNQGGIAVMPDVVMPTPTPISTSTPISTPTSTPTPTPTPTPPTSALGDVDNNGIINSTDVNLLRSFLVGRDVCVNEENADLNDDGAVSILDLTLLRLYLAGRVVTLV